MRKKILLSLFSLPLLVATASAQTFQVVSPGSKYVCGFMPDGSNLLFADKNGDRQLVSPNKAIGKVKNEIVAAREKIERLKDIKASLRDDGRLSQEEIRELKKIHKSGFGNGVVFPKSKKERREAIDQLIAIQKISIQNKQAEVTAIRDCKDGKRPDRGTSVTYEIKRIQAAGGSIYIALIMYVPKSFLGVEAVQRFYCVRSAALPTGSRGQPYLFTTNPCFDGTPPFSQNNCTHLVGPGLLADFFAFRIFGPGLSLDHPLVIEAERQFNEQWAAGVIGRVRGFNGAPGTASTNADTCATVEP